MNSSENKMSKGKKSPFADTVLLAVKDQQEEGNPDFLKPKSVWRKFAVTKTAIEGAKASHQTGESAADANEAKN